MKLERLSLISILACVVALVLLLAFGGLSFQELRQRQQEVGEMLLLQQRVNAFSTASDSMLLYQPDSDMWRIYEAEARSLENTLLDMANKHPDTRKVVNSIRRLMEMVEKAVALGAAGRGTGTDTGFLAMPERSRLIMNQVAMNGVTMDTTLSDALHERRVGIYRATRNIVLQFAAVGVLFGVLCVVAFALVHHRITRPVLTLARTIGLLQSGDDTVRVPVVGNDELSQLAQSFNHLVDQLQVRENNLLKLKNRYERAESVANLGSWEASHDSGWFWSPRAFEILGLNPEIVDASETVFLERIHPDDRDWFMRRRDQWLEGGDPDFDEEHRIVRPDGSVRWVRQIARLNYSPDGRPDYFTGTIQDVTGRKERERELGILSERLRHVLETITEGMLVLDQEFRHQFSNTTAAALLEEDPVSVRRDPVEAMTRSLGGEVRTLLGRAVADGNPVSSEFFHAASGRWLEVRTYPGGNEVTLFIRDVSTRHQATEEIGRTLALRRALINALPAHIALIDEQGVIQDVNEQWRHFARGNAYSGSGFGLGTNYLEVCDLARGECADEASEVAAGLRDVLEGRRDLFVMEYPCHSPHEERWFRVMANRLSRGVEENLSGAVVMHVDITERKLAERELEMLAFYDSLTGLHNRHGFERELNEKSKTCWQPEAMVVLLDIAGLRDINEVFGYAMGDRVLVEIGRRLSEHTDEGGAVCRLGGDEFALFVPPAVGITRDEHRRAISLLFSHKLEIDGHAITVTARCGYTVLGRERRSVDALLAEAELALYRSPEPESLNGLSWVMYTSRFSAQLRIREDLVHELRRATEEGTFELHFQPKIRMSDGMLIAGEALLRWPHPRLGLQSPGVFIPLAEQSQLIGPIGDWVLNEACRHLRNWQQQGLDIVCIAVNVSIQQFLTGDIVATVRNALEKNGLKPWALSLEITESVFEAESSALRSKLLELHEMGVRLSLDDFGTGYSSLLYLQRYPFDEIKIDRAFASRVLTDSYCRHVVKTVVELAAVLNAEVVAEGIENREVGDALRALGCGIGQGFYYSLPLEAEDFRWLLERKLPLPVAKPQQEGHKIRS